MLTDLSYPIDDLHPPGETLDAPGEFERGVRSFDRTPECVANATFPVRLPDDYLIPGWLDGPPRIDEDPEWFDRYPSRQFRWASATGGDLHRAGLGISENLKVVRFARRTQDQEHMVLALPLGVATSIPMLDDAGLDRFWAKLRAEGHEVFTYPPKPFESPALDQTRWIVAPELLGGHSLSFDAALWPLPDDPPDRPDDIEADLLWSYEHGQAVRISTASLADYVRVGRAWDASAADAIAEALRLPQQGVRLLRVSRRLGRWETVTQFVVCEHDAAFALAAEDDDTRLERWCRYRGYGDGPKFYWEGDAWCPV